MPQARPCCASGQIGCTRPQAWPSRASGQLSHTMPQARPFCTSGQLNHAVPQARPCRASDQLCHDMTQARPRRASGQWLGSTSGTFSIYDYPLSWSPGRQQSVTLAAILNPGSGQERKHTPTTCCPIGTWREANGCWAARLGHAVPGQLPQ